MPDVEADKAEIVEIVRAMFDAISWTETRAPDLEAFAAKVRKDGIMVPAARPPQPVGIDVFKTRMASQRGPDLRTFEERALGTEVQVFGNVATAMGGFEMRANGGEVRRGVNAFLFVRGIDGWEIAAVAWDNESQGVSVPPQFLAG